MLKKTVLVHALAIAFGGAALTVGTMQTAMAQSNAAGTIFGTVDSPAGATINMINTETGTRRSITPDASGRYTATSMAPGHYRVELLRNGAVANTTEVDVIVGQGVDASFASAAVASNVQSVRVTGRRTRIDVSNTNNGAVFTAKELARLPTTQNVEAIIQLAPNTTRADSRYSAGASFGGGGASENSYYINGFPVTNPVTQLGASELPFGAIAQAQVLTGGFGAEFGRSVGGVVNITTKSGTNTWEAGASAYITPKSLRASPKDIYYPNTGSPLNTTTDGTLYVQRNNLEREEKMYGAYVGGPLIKDRLFMFAAIERRTDDLDRVIGIRTSSALASTGFESTQDKTDRYLVKLDANITDNHRLEATFIGDEGKEDRQLYGYTYPTSGVTGGTIGAQTASQHYKNSEDFGPGVGGNVQILRYTGTLTDNLTVTALVGQMKTPASASYDAVGNVPADIFQISAPSNARAPGLNYFSPQVLSGAVSSGSSESKVKSRRFDVEYKLGDHFLRAGIDSNKLDSEAIGQVYGGGGIWVYAKTANPNTPLAFGPTRASTASGGGLGTQGYYVSRRIFDSLTSAGSEQEAQYIEDRWQVNKDVLVTLGLRNESFKNINGDGETFLEAKDLISPRAAASWDVFGDASLKVYGSAGRYALQIPTHLAVRGASRSTFTRQAFTYTGTDQYGQPTGLNPISGVYSTNNELGQAKDARTVSARNIEATYQDELTLGFERALTPDLNVGARITYRTLKATIDDLCDPRPFEAYAERNNINTDNWGGFGCASFNPGEASTFLVDYAGTGNNLTEVNLSKADLGFDDPKRTYTAVDLFAEHPYRNGWYGRVNYTWSKSRGNTEGQTKSDNAQTDVAATSTWDNPELMVNAYGLLPNHREHQIKAFGYYDLTPEVTLGGNFLAASGRPKNCFGWDPNVPPEADYGSVFFYCNGGPAPRGTSGKLPWDVRLDLSVAYRPAMVKGLAVKLDVFNVANKQTVQTIDETYNVGSTTDVSPTYGRVISYTAPRSVRLGVEYNHRF
ncbi:TonB-dependent receptor [Massilia suwonensis]|uniref:Carboxypeptidase regulatory-like domain-containing protein n=1 Tax=Massilia suwonensis TaxID=648895 RepID=A0ABW0MEY3_9BURK